MVFAQKSLIPHQPSVGQYPLHGAALFLVTEALGSSEGEVWFSQVNEEETPVGTCQQPSIIMLELRFELRHLKCFLSVAASPSSGWQGEAVM